MKENQSTCIRHAPQEINHNSIPKTNQSLPGFLALTGVLFLCWLVLLATPVLAAGQSNITGIVFHDLNENNQHDSGEPGIPGVLVSNGKDMVATDGEGRYEISSDDNSVVFVIKPRDWKTSVDNNGIPQFYHLRSSNGAGGAKYPGLKPTGSFPESVDFALYPQEESDRFRAVVFGDTQPRDGKEVNYIAHDTVEELIGVEAAFGFTLGDLVFDNLHLLQSIAEVVGQIGLPWHHVMGNHDIDYSAESNWNARGAYHQTFGPSYYAFTWGSAHFVVVDNIRWVQEGEKRYYRTGLGEAQMSFIRNYLEQVPEDELVMFLMHIPWVGSTPWKDEAEREELFSLLASHPHTVSLAAHMHRHYHRFIGPGDGWPGEKPHHLMSMGTVCGAWWAGAPDEYGIPHSMMRDGAPTGYGFLEVSGNEWKLRYKAARRPADFQMHIYAPDELPSSAADSTEVFANVFNALPDAQVQMRIGKSGPWLPMSRVKKEDPFYTAMHQREHSYGDVSWRKSGPPNPDPRHLWQAVLPGGLDAGAHTITVRAEDEWYSYEGRRIIRVTDPK